MNEQILLVDDEPNLRAAMQRAFRKQFALVTAASGSEGLQILQTEPMAVVVSDFRMPDMDGVEFLAAARRLRPQSTRILLTGHADLNTAIGAINDGRIFRLLTKPIRVDEMQKALQHGIEQYRLVTAERELLSQTLLGSVKVLLDLLERICPPAVQRSARLQSLVRNMAIQMDLPDLWQYELAAMLSQVGYLLAPSDLLNTFYSGRELTPREQKQLIELATAGRDLLVQIPRLEKVAEMIGRQRWVFPPHSFATEPEHRDPITLGAQMLQTADEYETRLARGQTHVQAIQSMRFSGNYDTHLVHVLDWVARRDTTPSNQAGEASSVAHGPR